jgi:hypothetical protein
MEVLVRLRLSLSSPLACAEDVFPMIHIVV